MGHISRKKMRCNIAEKKLNIKLTVGGEVQFWCPIYNEVVDGMLMSISNNDVELLYLGGLEIRTLVNFHNNHTNDRQGWWLKSDKKGE